MELNFEYAEKNLSSPFNVLVYNMKNTLLFYFTFLGFSLIAQNNTYPLGYWYGQLELMGTNHEILFLVSPEYSTKNNKVVKGKYVAELLNPADSSSFPVRVNPVVFTQKTFQFAIKDLNLSYSGKPSRSFEEVDGRFEQSGMSANLKFSRSRFTFHIAKRPQTPQPPFSYHTREVKIAHNKEKFQLAGTLTLPSDTTQPFPLVVMASGSGAQDRNEDILGHKLFFVLADHLAKNGIGSLRFDDRGVGSSGGVFSQASLTGFSEDVESVFEYLRKNTSFGANKMGILGHSEGAMHAWMVAKRREDVDFIISLAGPAISGRQIIEQQQYDIARLISEEQALWSRDLFRGVLEIITQKSNPSEANKVLEKFIKSYHKKSPTKLKNENPLNVLLQSIPPFFNSPWGREFIAWNPDDYLPNYKGKILYIIGDKDLQVNPELNFNGFLKYLKHYNPQHIGALTFENLNHLLQTCKTCTVEEYGKLEETVNVFVLNEIVVFLKNV